VSVEQWRSLVASIWPVDQVDNVLAVMNCESGGNPYAHNTNGEDSRGLLQINVGPGAHTDMASLDLFDPATNLRAAFQIWQASGWSPWSCARIVGLVGGGSSGGGNAVPIGAGSPGGDSGLGGLILLAVVGIVVWKVLL
jgi:hypothetical protein